MLNKVNLLEIRSFVLIAQLGNFTRAAEALKVSRSHISRQMTQLESDLGVTLLIRTTRTLKLTQAGQKLFEQCQIALGHIDQALLSAIDDVEEVRGHIAINCVGGVLGEDILVPMINEFMSLYPDVRVSLDFSSHRVDLIQDDFDIAFRMSRGQIYGILKSTYGFHLILLEKKIKKRDLSLAEATPIIRRKLLKKRQAEEFRKWVDLAQNSVSVRIPKPLW